MYSFAKGYPHVKIDLDNGIYIFRNQSAIGKSYLAERLHELRSAGEPVDSFTFSDIAKFGGPDKALSGLDFNMRDLKVVLFDRYDLYVDRFTSTLQELAGNSIVLVDCKKMSKFGMAKRCYIQFTSGLIEVM